MIDAQAVADHLGVQWDTRVDAAAQAATSWAEKRRCLTDPAVLWADPDVILGACLYAALLYQARTTPTGMVGYDEAGLYNQSTQEGLWRARELVGLDPVVA